MSAARDGIYRQFVDDYNLPVPTPLQAWPEPVRLGRVAKRVERLRGDFRKRRSGRRLAYLDSTFPWERSGFRYHEALALQELRPETMFFSVWELLDPFPAPVYPLAEFPRLALREGITDAYGAFSLFLEGLCGLRSGAEDPHPMEGLDISAVRREAGIRLHGTIFPGGGFTATPDGLARARALAACLDTIISYVPEALANLPGAVYVPQALTETRYYPVTSERWERSRPLTCLFAADTIPRKGLDVALAAFADLDPSEFHLHLVGPHEQRRDEFPAELMTFHGWLSPAELRSLHRQAHVFLSPVSAEPPGPPGSYLGVTDGFPTQAAADAMCGGVLLLSANPAGDHRVLTPGEHYLELPATPEAFRGALRELAADPERARRIAEAGSDRVREQMDVRRGVALKLEAMGLHTASSGSG